MPKYKGCVACGANRIGKELTETQVVPMADGSYKTMRDIAIGDYVLSYDIKSGEAKPVIVTNKWDNGMLDCYKITFSDGASVETAGTHPFPVKLRSGKYISRPRGRKEPIKVVKRTIDELRPRLGNAISLRTRMLSPVSVEYLPSITLPVHPYVLGVLLGDGSIVNKNSLAVTSKDETIINRLKENLDGLALISRRTKSISHGLIKAEGLADKLDKLGLMGTKSGTKFIPEIYLSASIEDRKQLLAGLIDTDGFKFGFCVKSPMLADGFQKLVRSLGGKATIQVVEKTCTNAKDGPKKGTYHNVTWRAYDIPVELKYKMPERTKRNCDYTSRIVRSIEPTGKHQCYCIEIDHPDHCFLVGDFVATCNSHLGGFITALIVTGQHPTYKSPKNGRAWIVGPDSKVLEGVEKPYFEGHMPKRYMENGKWNGKHQYWTLKADGREWEVWYKSVESGRAKFQGDAIDFAWVDEEPLKEGVFRELELRMLDKQAPWLMTATPVEGTKWLKDILDREEVFYTMAGMRENPYIPMNEIDKLCKTLPEDERLVRVEGSYIQFGGRPVFNRKILAAMEEAAGTYTEGILAVA